MKRLFIHHAVITSLLSLSLASSAALAGGKKRQEQKPAEVTQPIWKEGKRVLALAPIRNVEIKMPDDTTRNFGADFQARLTTHLTEGDRFIVVDPEHDIQVGAKTIQSRSGEPYYWAGSFLPSATVKISVDAMTFSSGARGGKLTYGFDDRTRNDFNDGTANEANEFPLKEGGNWFDHYFDAKGSSHTSSLSGLDLGEGLSINLLFAWLRIKYVRYQSELHLKAEIEAPLAGRNEVRTVRVNGKGFYYDVAGGYLTWTAAVRIARREAMLQAFNRAIDGTLKVLEKSIGELPLTAQVDNISSDGMVFVGTGRDARVARGTLFELIDRPDIAIQIDASYLSGSVARVVAGDFKGIRPGARLRQISKLPDLGDPGISIRRLATVSPVSMGTETITLPDQNFSKPNFNGTVSDISTWKAFLKSILEIFVLPYRVWRYNSYDQSYKESADWSPDTAAGNEAPDLSERIDHPEDWAEANRAQPWAKQIGLSDAARMPDSPVVVAVIDTGIDYNHPALHDALWLNPSPVTDALGRQDRYGWDFISNDSRPHDDHYHGTQVASAILAVAPGVKIMPLKVFNPYGVTNSGSLYGAFKYAVEHGANLIVCAWSTRHYSKAIEMGVAYARDHGIKVVTAAGDSGINLSQFRAYPASLAAKYDNVIPVAAVDSRDQLASFSNRGSQLVPLAAPGVNILVAEPRNRYARASSTGIAAAIAAGAFARALAEDPGITFPAFDALSPLSQGVQEGRRVRVDR